MANKHLVNLWISTLLLAPFIHAGYELVFGVEGQIVGLLKMLPITLMFSVLLSLPTLLIVVLTNKLTSDIDLSNRSRKFLNIILAASGLFTTLFVIGGSLILTLIKTYLISLVAAALIIELAYKSNIIQENSDL